MQRTLEDFGVGESGVVLKIGGQGQVRQRLIDMGVTPGAEIVMKKSAPLGDPIEVSLRGYELSLRKTEASIIFMKEKGGSK